MDSGATVWEIRTLADELNDIGRPTNKIAIHGPFRNAILVEALNCLADKKEAERATKA